MTTSKFYPLYRWNIDIGDIQVDVSLSVSPISLLFNEGVDSKNVQVIIIPSNEPYTVTTPSWLHVSNQTSNGFTLTSDDSPTDQLRSGTVTIKLTNYPTKIATVSVQQSGAWLSQFIFDVNVDTAGQTISRIVNLGAEVEGQAMFDYGDGTVETLTVPQSEPVEMTAQDGTHYTVYNGTDFPHTFSSSGTKRVTIKVRQGVNAFRFSAPQIGSTLTDWGFDFYLNPYIRKIYKIKSPSLETIYKMFAGCSRASFDSSFDGLETPIVTDVSFAFENFGAQGVHGNGGLYNYTVDDNMRFPANMYQHFTKKNQITSCVRTYYKSAFERIEPSMLTFSSNDTLVSAFETFRQMYNVGANWVLKYGNPMTVQELLDMPEFVDSTLFHNQRNIQNFEGVFNFINDFYGNFGVNNYGYKWIIKRTLFEGNQAEGINMNWAFNKATRAILEDNFFGAVSPLNGKPIAQRIKTMTGCFWDFGDGNPRIAYGLTLPNFNGCRIDQHPDSLFPDAQYPMLENMIGAFGYYGSSGEKRNANSGFQGLIGIASLNWGTTFWNVFQINLGFVMNNLNIAAFLARFPNCTETSGIELSDGETVIDGASYNFGDYDAVDDNTPPAVKAEDLASFASSYPTRAKVVEWKKIN